MQKKKNHNNIKNPMVPLQEADLQTQDEHKYQDLYLAWKKEKKKS